MAVPKTPTGIRAWLHGPKCGCRAWTECPCGETVRCNDRRHRHPTKDELEHARSIWDALLWGPPMNEYAQPSIFRGLPNDGPCDICGAPATHWAGANTRACEACNEALADRRIREGVRAFGGPLERVE